MRCVHLAAGGERATGHAVGRGRRREREAEQKTESGGQCAHGGRLRSGGSGYPAPRSRDSARRG